MKRISNKIILLAFALCFSTISHAQIEAFQKLIAGKHNDYGILYSLPNTHLRIEVEAEQTVKKKGEFFNYAQKYLGTANVITEDSQSWTLKSVKVTSYGTPTDKKQYIMSFKAGSAPFLVVDKNGMPLAINTTNVVTETHVPTESTPLTTSVLNDNAYTTALSGELLASGSLARRAEIAANTIYKIRESRTNFAIGEADQMPPDGESLKLVLNELNKQEEALMALFLGTTQTATAVKTFDYIPADSLDREVLMRISNINGITSKDDYSGEPLYIKVTTLKKGYIPLDEKGLEKKLPKGAVMYNIPGKAKVEISYEGKKWFEGTFDIAQLGVDFGLDPAIFTDKKNPSYVKFHPTTGGIHELGAMSAEDKANNSPSKEKE